MGAVLCYNTIPDGLSPDSYHARIMMNKKDIADIKRRLNPEKNGITCVRGCYVNDQGDVVSSFTRFPAAMGREEAEKFLALFKRVLSGTQGQNLLDVDFSPEQVMDSPEHRLLTALKDTALRDDDAVNAFFAQVIASLPRQEHHLVLLLHDGYGLPRRSGPEDREDADTSGDVFHYVLCAVCPVRLTKPALTYDPGRNDFFSKEADWIVSAPEMGFLFPAFEERAANIYRALYYTRDTAENHMEFVDAVFRAALPPPADQQQELFQTVLETSLREECSMEVMQALHDQVVEKLEEQKADKRAEPLRLTKYDVQDVLAGCGVQPERVEAFARQYDAAFGEQARLSAVNIANPKQFSVRTPQVTIQVASDRTDLVETRTINGHVYILIRADEGVSVNGVSVTP